jgi:hypothetical protein
MKEEKVRALKKIVEEVCDINLSIKSSERPYINARSICYKILMDSENMSCTFIGNQFKKTHDTILYSMGKFDSYIMSNRQMERDYKKILSIWGLKSEEYKAMGPLELKKAMNDLLKQNKLLNLSVDKRLKEMDDKLQKLLSICQE